MKFSRVVSAIIAVTAISACDDFNRVEDNQCAGICLDSFVGICPQSIIVSNGNLKAGSCASLGYTVANGTQSVKAGPCGTLNFDVFAKGALAMGASATTPDVILATFDGVDKATTFTWEAKNDPVMGGSSTSSAGVSDGALVFSGTCAIVKYLQAPGFASVHTTADQVFNRADKAVNGSFNLMLRSSTPTYTGFKVGWSAKGIPIKPKFGRGDGSFKASFQLQNQTDWQVVNVPMSAFSDDWSPFSGECDTKDPIWSGGQQHHCCGAGDDAQYCPTPAFLSALTDLSIWAEGVAGDFQVELKWIGASFA